MPAALLLAISATGADAATRVLPASYRAGTTIRIRIDLTVPAGTTVVAIEDTPPLGWIGGNVSDNGGWDSQSLSVKWGPFFAPSIPSSVTYDATIPASASGEACFTGLISINGPEEPITGALCVATSVPAVSSWGLAILTLFLATIATMIIERRHADWLCSRGPEYRK